MTLWARKSGFQETFGEKWAVEMNEFKSTVEFIITPNEDISIDVNSTNLTRLINYMTGIGEDEVEMFYDDDREFGFRVIVPRTSLPEDYDEELY